MHEIVLLAQSNSNGLIDHILRREDFLPLLIPIVAIIGGISFAIIKAVIRHRERMAMIEHGMNPDAEKPE